jgi:hypothetical protein
MSFSVNGGRFRSLLRMDPKARQMESYIFDSQGVALERGFTGNPQIGYAKSIMDYLFRWIAIKFLPKEILPSEDASISEGNATEGSDGPAVRSGKLVDVGKQNNSSEGKN